MPQAARFGVALVLFLAVVAGMHALSSRPHSWEAWRPALCMPDDCFCERLRPGVLRQPVNAWTNLAFVLLGLGVLTAASIDASRARFGEARPLVAAPVYSAIYGLAALLIGLGGTFYHASLTFAGLWLDLLGMYLLANFMLLYTLCRLGHLGRGSFVLAYLLANLASAALLTVWPEVGRHGFGAILLAAFAADIAARRQARSTADPRFLFGAVGSFVVAFAIWTLDLLRVVCSPESWLQGHGVWHVLTAAAAGLVYLYFRSEEPQRAARR